jgi:hypothetical protein
MEVIWQICLRTTELSIFLFGILGALASLFLLFSPDRIRAARNWFDRIYNMDRRIAELNRYIQTDKIAYSHHIIFGLCLVVASVILLIFLFFGIDHIHFSDLIMEMVFNSLVLLGKIAGFVGVIIGVLLVFIPGQMKILETRMNVWVDTQPFVDKLNQFHPVIDEIFLRYPIIFGTAGLLASLFIIGLSILSFLN